ncbi:MAG: DUF3127 domain-containing protein [Muribaculaceae bacterium]|nr:DUF3127 domain-containing protein [Muribaculaceae bacterium]
MDFQGKVIQFLGETSGISKAGNAWKKKEWVFETISQYPRKVKVHIFGDRADTINLELGKNYTVHFDIESREFNGRWYTDISVFRAEEVGDQASSAQFQQPGSTGYQQPQMPYGNTNFGNTGAFGDSQSFQGAPDDSDEDLPF